MMACAALVERDGLSVRGLGFRGQGVCTRIEVLRLYRPCPAAEFRHMVVGSGCVGDVLWFSGQSLGVGVVPRFSVQGLGV